MLAAAAALALAYVPTGSFDYPSEALLRGEQGISVIAFEVDATGRAFACRVVSFAPAAASVLIKGVAPS